MELLWVICPDQMPGLNESGSNNPPSNHFRSNRLRSSDLGSSQSNVRAPRSRVHLLDCSGLSGIVFEPKGEVSPRIDRAGLGTFVLSPPKPFMAAQSNEFRRGL